MDNEGYIPKEHQTSCDGETGCYQTDAETPDLNTRFHTLVVMFRCYLGYIPLHTTCLEAFMTSIYPLITSPSNFIVGR